MKKVICLLMCLLLAVSLLAFASCDNNDSSGSSSTQSSKIDGSGEAIGGTSDVTDSVAEGSNSIGSVDGGADASDSSIGGSDESDGETSKDDAESGSESNTEDSGNTDSSNETENSGSENDKGDENENKITISFVCFMYEPVSGETEVKIDKGSVLLAEQMPVYERKDYVVVWSYDMFGEEKWQPTDVFNEDTELYGTWVEVNLFEELKEKLSGLTNFQMDSVVMTETATGSYSHNVVDKYNGDNVYMSIIAGEMSEVIWYGDGIYYTEIDGNMISQEMSREEFDSAFGSEVVTEDSFFGVKKDLVKSISKNGLVYTIVLDDVKYTESLPSDMPVKLVYSSMNYKFTLDENGMLISIVSEYSYTQDGNEVNGKSTSQISNVGSTVVEAPEVK